MAPISLLHKQTIPKNVGVYFLFLYSDLHLVIDYLLKMYTKIYT